MSDLNEQIKTLNQRIRADVSPDEVLTIEIWDTETTEAEITAGSFVIAQGPLPEAVATALEETDTLAKCEEMAERFRFSEERSQTDALDVGTLRRAASYLRNLEVPNPSNNIATAKGLEEIADKLATQGETE